VKFWLQRALLVLVGLFLIAKLTPAAVYDRNGNQITDAGGAINWELLSAAKGKNYNGIGVVSPENNSGWICTAFLLNSLPTSDKTKAPSQSTKTLSIEPSPAYALTNGHCSNTFSFPGVDELIIKQPSDLFVVLNWFFDVEPEQRIQIPIKKVLYTTTTGTDIAILELDTTYQQLVASGFQPLTIDPNPPTVGESVELIGAPDVSDYYLHRAVCKTGKSVNLREGSQRWTGSIRHRCSAISGMSGSPLISLRTHRVVAIHNTSIKPKALSQPECSDDRPCEVLADSKTVTVLSENYAQRVSDIPACFDEKGIFNLQLSKCRLNYGRGRAYQVVIIGIVTKALVTIGFVVKALLKNNRVKKIN
jgi:hypothetical protein